ncbi:MAG: hypothetical protein A2787_08885 [Omnitrophica WOR_2 bacterium RIFCSPHIGHO2_01_FULL_48_9]|nr:MAG: hypothetical protein A2787_08885 [Omnitrophica WOR_2 bacterium RIFCSPHIGHO2_01_FULL_48_9]
MKIRNNKSGFTLLEIIIVLIIIGVLASLALPRFFALVETSRGGEALNTLSAIRGSMVRYALRNGNSYTGANLGTIDVGDPSVGAANKHFTYTTSVAAGNPSTAFTVIATRNTNNGGTGGTVYITQDDAAGTVVRGGTGPFAGI